MEIITTVRELQSRLDDARKQGKSIALVPTMGALHGGHKSLVDRAVKENDVTVVSVFVNPTQFNNPHDLETYPRDPEADARLLEQAGVTIAFMPTVKDVYPTADTRQFNLGPVAQVMEGKMRPGHFNGVAQVVSRLFDFVKPDKAYFGEKDFQQIAVLRSMLKITGQKVEIVPCPIKRYDDGLAMSSRNTLLSPRGRQEAPLIHKTLAESTKKATQLTIGELRNQVIETLNANELMDVEYYQIVDPVTLQPLDDKSKITAEAVGCITVHCDGIRLIDNIHYYPEGHDA